MTDPNSRRLTLSEIRNGATISLGPFAREQKWFGYRWDSKNKKWRLWRDA